MDPEPGGTWQNEDLATIEAVLDVLHVQSVSLVLVPSPNAPRCHRLLTASTSCSGPVRLNPASLVSLPARTHTKTLHPPPQCVLLLNLSSANTSSLRYILFFHPSGCPYRPFGVLLFTVVAVRCKRPIRFTLSTLPTSAAFGQIIHTVASRSSGGLYIHDSIANIFCHLFSI